MLTTYVQKSLAIPALGGTISQIEDIFAKGGSIAFVGFGKFSIAEHAAENSRNPQASEKLKIPASKTAKFVPGKEMKEAVNKQENK